MAPSDAPTDAGKTRAYYDEFSDWYERDRGAGTYHEMIDELELAIAMPYARGASVLEVGCGTGLILHRLARVAREAHGVDLSPGMLEKARARGLSVREASATSLPFEDDRFDMTCSFKVLAHVPDIALALREMARVTAPGGTVLAEFYNPYSLRRLAKQLGGPGKISEKTTEAAVYTRFDAPAALKRYTPAGCEFVGLRPVRVFTPMAAAIRVPVLGSLLRRAEFAAQALPPLANVAGFVVAVYRKR